MAPIPTLEDFTKQLADWGVYENAVQKLQEALTDAGLAEHHCKQIVEHFFESLAYQAQSIVEELVDDGGIDDFDFED